MANLFRFPNANIEADPDQKVAVRGADGKFYYVTLQDVLDLPLAGHAKRSVGNALTAVGTNRSTALPLTDDINNVTAAATGTGVQLPVGEVGMEIDVYIAAGVAGAAVQVYAAGSETIDTVAGATGVPLTKAKRCRYTFVAANTWLSAQHGVVSA